MALSIVSVGWRSTNRLLYYINQTGNNGIESLTIPNDGGPSPDLQTDALAGIGFGPAPIGGLSLYRLMRVRNNGWPPIPAGPIIQDQARALLMGFDELGMIITNPLIRYATTRVQALGNTAALAWSLDASVDAEGDPVLIVSSCAFNSVLNRGQCLIEIRMMGCDN